MDDTLRAIIIESCQGAKVTFSVSQGAGVVVELTIEDRYTASKVIPFSDFLCTNSNLIVNTLEKLRGDAWRGKRASERRPLTYAD